MFDEFVGWAHIGKRCGAARGIDCSDQERGRASTIAPLNNNTMS